MQKTLTNMKSNITTYVWGLPLFWAHGIRPCTLCPNRLFKDIVKKRICEKTRMSENQIETECADRSNKSIILGKLPTTSFDDNGLPIHTLPWRALWRNSWLLCMQKDALDSPPLELSKPCNYKDLSSYGSCAAAWFLDVWFAWMVCLLSCLVWIHVMIHTLWILHLFNDCMRMWMFHIVCN